MPDKDKASACALSAAHAMLVEKIAKDLYINGMSDGLLNSPESMLALANDSIDCALIFVKALRKKVLPLLSM